LLVINLTREALRANTIPTYLLSLDLIVSGQNQRTIRWNRRLSQPAYPEEAIDELRRWSPGSHHTIYALRGRSADIRLPYSQESQELQIIHWSLTAAILLGAAGFAALSILHGRPWLLLALLGVAAGIGGAWMASEELNRRANWRVVTARPSPAEASPPDVFLTSEAAATLPKLTHRVLAFDLDGVTLHAGIGNLDGPYDILYQICAKDRTPCQFRVNSRNRWDVSTHTEPQAAVFVTAACIEVLAFVFLLTAWRVRQSAELTN